MQENCSHIGKLGEILLRQGLISNSQLMKVLADQGVTNEAFEDLLVTQHIMTKEQLGKNLANQFIRLGNVLLQKKMITLEQLNEALSKQNETSKRLGLLLTEKGYISAGQLESALKEQYWRQNGFWVID